MDRCSRGVCATFSGIGFGIGRQLPPQLSDAQRSALSEFIAGHLSAGQLSERLSLRAESPALGAPAQDDVVANGHRRRWSRGWAFALVATAIGGAAVGIGLGSAPNVAGSSAIHVRPHHEKRRRHSAGAHVSATATAAVAAPGVVTGGAQPPPAAGQSSASTGHAPRKHDRVGGTTAHSNTTGAGTTSTAAPPSPATTTATTPTTTTTAPTTTTTGSG